jgi:hypothetical protein
MRMFRKTSHRRYRDHRGLMWCGAGVLGVLCGTGIPAHGQMIAFPGAEGAGQHAAGGRGGDVYWVTNLNDSGAGSLRAGISSATGPRTIMFAVGGTIHLQSDLNINRPNITIAGQTAPGGGITLADRMTRISNTHNVIVQHLRFRPGDTYTGSGYEPDSLWVSGSNNIMVDHVTASWSTDEVLSVTHGSHNVTVQWSMISEALHNADHSKGNHGYGSLINGGDITFHNNLYAHNRSRNPRPGGSSVAGQTTRLDFVNNVIYNPGDQSGYSGGSSEQLRLNFVGNIGIDGPNTNTGSRGLFHGGATSTHIYSAGNLRDANKNGLFDPPSGTILSGQYTSVGSRFNLPEVDTVDARQAYIQVMSHAGASSFRDAVDNRVVRSVINQNGTHIDRQHEVGGWPVLPGGTSPTFADGIPDWWKIAHGLNVNQQYHQVDSGDGYTWLEKYLHSLSRPHFPAEQTELFQVQTGFGRGADAQVNENDGQSSGSGSSTNLNARWTGSGSGSNRNEYILLRFDVSHVQQGSLADAALELTAFRDMGNQTLRVYGLDHHVANQAWQEGSIEFANAPGLVFDGDSRTRGLIQDDVLLLGAFNTSGMNEGDVIQFNNANLAVFLNLLSYSDRPEGEEGLVTLLIEAQSAGSGQSRFASKEATTLQSGAGSFRAGAFAPRLIVDGALSWLPGDANGDGRVDIADLGILAANWQQSGRSWQHGNFNGDGWVDIADLGVLAGNWQSGVGGMEGIPLAEALSMFDAFDGVVIPEPSAMALVGLSGLLLRRRSRHERTR